MKTDILKLSFMALAVTAFMVGCTQDGDLVNTTDTNNKVLKITTTVKDFTPDANTRVVDEVDPENGNNYVTKFQEGDEMGVYAFMEDGTVMCKNLPMTYTKDGKWASDAPLYFYKNATYIAYSPYNANISNVELTSENAISAITDYFVTTVFTDASKTYAECDLMTASVTTDNNLPEADASAITFNFAHAMSMVEFVIPIKKYKSPTTGYEYSGPVFEVKLQKQEGTGAKVDVTALALGKGVYRSLLAPVAANAIDKDMIFHGEMMVGDGTQPVYFSTKTAFKPEAGKYKKVTVAYTNSPDATVEDRDLKVGDYYYADGGIVPGDAATIPSKNCIGIVYSTDMTGSDTGKKNAYVIALGDTEKVNGDKVFWWQGDNTVTDIIPRFDTAVEGSFDTMMADMNGYTVKSKLLEVGKLNSFEACAAAAGVGAKAVVTPVGTSGWYLPTIAQLATAFCNLAKVQPGITVGQLINTSAEQYTALLELFKKVGYTDLPESGDTYCLWTCTDLDDNSAWTLKFNLRNSTKNIEVAALKKKNQGSRIMHIRAILAF